MKPEVVCDIMEMQAFKMAMETTESRLKQKAINIVTFSYKTFYTDSVCVTIPIVEIPKS